MPDVFKLNLILTTKPDQSETISLSDQFYILERVDHLCAEDFVYEVSAFTHSFLVRVILLKELILTFKWNEKILDFHGVFIKPDFTNSRHFLTGAYENIYMRIVLKHELLPIITQLQ